MYRNTINDIINTNVIEMSLNNPSRTSGGYNVNGYMCSCAQKRLKNNLQSITILDQSLIRPK